jgi:hypothetical protein
MRNAEIAGRKRHTRVVGKLKDHHEDGGHRLAGVRLLDLQVLPLILVLVDRFARWKKGVGACQLSEVDDWRSMRVQQVA